MIPKHLQVALSQLGEKEVDGQSDNLTIVDYLDSVGIHGHDEIPWCAAFVNWCFKKGGVRGTGSGRAKSYLNWGLECGCEPGSVAVMNRGLDAAMGHVAFVVQDCGSYCITVGGNQNNSVSLAIVNKSKIIAYRKAA